MFLFCGQFLNFVIVRLPLGKPHNLFSGGKICHCEPPTREAWQSHLLGKKEQRLPRLTADAVRLAMTRKFTALPAMSARAAVIARAPAGSPWQSRFWWNKNISLRGFPQGSLAIPLPNEKICHCEPPTREAWQSLLGKDEIASLPLALTEMTKSLRSSQ